MRFTCGRCGAPMIPGVMSDGWCSAECDLRKEKAEDTDYVELIHVPVFWYDKYVIDGVNTVEGVIIAISYDDENAAASYNEDYFIVRVQRKFVCGEYRSRYSPFGLYVHIREGAPMQVIKRMKAGT